MTFSKNLIFILSLLVFCGYSIAFWSYSIDDAFITFRYAENFADGHGLVFNLDDQPLEGYSNFLWLLILAFLYKLGLPTYLCAKLIGLISFPAAAFWLFRLNISKRNGLGWLAGPLFLISPITAFWGLSGLELGLHTLILTAAIVLLINRSRWFCAVLPFLILSRPEGVALGFGMIAVAALSDLANKRLNKTWLLTSLGVLAVTIIGLTIFRLQVFGYLLPNTYYAKIQHNIKLGFYELGRMLRLFAPLTLLMIWGLISTITQKLSHRELAICIGVFLLQAVISGRMDPVMNFLFRYMIMVLPFFVLTGLILISIIRLPFIKWLAIILVGGSLLAPFPKVIDFVQQTDLMTEAQYQLVDWAATLPAGTTISMSDMGRIPYASKHIHYYDLYGLTSEDVAHSGFVPRREFMRYPDYFIFVGYFKDEQLKLSFILEQAIAYHEVFGSFYQPHQAFVPAGKDSRDPGYYYFVFKRIREPVPNRQLSGRKG